jgi:leader peptidase (prepilin peptidase)/N-methyltransferase
LTADPLPIALAGVCGLLFGSFLNVCIYRLPRDVSIVTPRSFCPECGAQVSWYDNVPLISYLVLRGRCRGCGKPIGIRYFLVELTTAVLFAIVATEYGPTLSALKWAIFDALMIVLFWTDIEERLLPDELTIGGAAVGLAFATFVALRSVIGDLFFASLGWRERSVLNAALGALVFTIPIWLIAKVWQRFRNREVLALGDVKLLILMGVFLGMDDDLLACLIGSIAGSVLGLAYILWKRKGWSYELPFGSFLCFGAVLAPLISRR